MSKNIFFSLINKPIIILSFIMLVLCIFHTDSKAETNIIQPNETTPSEGCSFAGVTGRYIYDQNNALARINEIRLEACNEGVISPSTGKALTPDDYVPVKWSAELEYIAKLRATEASVFSDHERPNGKRCFSVYSPGNQKSWGEVLAWNSGTSMIQGINQWYREKDDWINETGGVTGHYTQMINPKNIYVGIGTFINYSGAGFANCTAGEYSDMDITDSIASSDEGVCTRIIEIKNDYLGSPVILYTKNNTVYNEKKLKDEKKLTGSVLELNMYYKVGGSEGSGYVSEMGNVTWSSSNESVAKVDARGTVTIMSSGKAVITAVNSSGAAAAFTIVNDDTKSENDTISTANSSADDKKITSLSKVNGITIKSAKKKLTLKWKSVKNASGYEISYSLNGKKSSSHNKTIKVRKTKKILKKLAAKKIYTIRIRAYYRNSSMYVYGKWSSIKKCKTK